MQCDKLRKGGGGEAIASRGSCCALYGIVGTQPKDILGGR